MRIRSRLKEEWMKTQRNKVGRNYSATLLGKVEILKKKSSQAGCEKKRCGVVKAGSYFNQGGEWVR